MRNQGFTLIEILVAIAIIGLMATVVVPNLFGPTASRERKSYIAKVNGLLFLGWRQALITHKIHQITFDIKKKKVHVDVVEGMDSSDKPKTAPVKIDYLQTSIEWPEQFELKNFYIEGTDEVKQNLGNKTVEEYWFYIMPDGIAQDVTINIIDTKDVLPDGSPRPVGLVLNPFSVQLKEYDTFQK